MRISTLVLASLAAFPVSASESAMSMPSERSPVVSELDTRARAIQNHGAANSALLIDLGPLPAEEKNTEIPTRTSKRRQIGIHRALPDEFTGDLVPHLEWVLAAVYIRALMANKGVAGTTRCRAGRQDAASRQASSRLLRCAPALRVTRPNVLTHRVFMAGSELPATSRPICENTSSPEVNPHILCSPFIRGFSQPPTVGGRRRRSAHRSDHLHLARRGLPAHRCSGRASSRCLSSNFRWRRAAARPRLHISRLQHRPSMAAERRRRHADGGDHASVHRCPG